MPRKSVNIAGRRFGMLVVLSRMPGKGHARWECKCDCGKSSVVLAYNLFIGHTKSCGCQQRESWRAALPFVIKHGNCRDGKLTPEYRAWRGIIQRCVDPNTREWEHYGGRGIGVCQHWRYSFEQFLADMGPRPEGLTLDRIDNDKGYLCPLCCLPFGNCRWTTMSEQIKNQRHKVFHEKRSKRMTAWWMSQTLDYRHKRAVIAARARWGG